MFDCEELRRLYWGDSQTLKQIAARCECSVTTIQRRMEHCGIERRRSKKKCPGCDVLLRLYRSEGQTLAEIAQEYGCTANAVERNMQRCGIERRARGRVPMEINGLAEMYDDMSVREIAELLGVSPPTITRAMDRAGIARSCRDPLPSFFEHDSAEMYYVLGLLFADGNISRQGRVTIHQTKYPAILHKIGHLLGRPVSGQLLTLGNQALAEWLLERFGVGPAKSNVLQWPVLPDQFAHDFIRGFFDGDGSIWIGRIRGKLRRSVSFTCGSKDFLLALKAVLQVDGWFGDVHSQTGHAYRLIYTGKAKAAWFYDYMYYPGC